MLTRSRLVLEAAAVPGSSTLDRSDRERTSGTHLPLTPTYCVLAHMEQCQTGRTHRKKPTKTLWSWDSGYISARSGHEVHKSRRELEWRKILKRIWCGYWVPSASCIILLFLPSCTTPLATAGFWILEERREQTHPSLGNSVFLSLT